MNNDFDRFDQAVQEVRALLARTTAEINDAHDYIDSLGIIGLCRSDDTLKSRISRLFDVLTSRLSEAEKRLTKTPSADSAVRAVSPAPDCPDQSSAAVRTFRASVVLYATIIGMQAANDARKIEGLSPAYTEADFAVEVTANERRLRNKENT